MYVRPTHVADNITYPHTYFGSVFLQGDPKAVQ